MERRRGILHRVTGGSQGLRTPKVTNISISFSLVESTVLTTLVILNRVKPLPWERTGLAVRVPHPSQGTHWIGPSTDEEVVLPL